MSNQSSYAGGSLCTQGRVPAAVVGGECSLTLASKLHRWTAGYQKWSCIKHLYIPSTQCKMQPAAAVRTLGRAAELQRSACSACALINASIAEGCACSTNSSRRGYSSSSSGGQPADGNFGAPGSHPAAGERRWRKGVEDVLVSEHQISASRYHTSLPPGLHLLQTTAAHQQIIHNLYQPAPAYGSQA